MPLTSLEFQQRIKTTLPKIVAPIPNKADCVQFSPAFDRQFVLIVTLVRYPGPQTNATLNVKPRGAAVSLSSCKST
jgi:hypothetical protein